MAAIASAALLGACQTGAPPSPAAQAAPPAALDSAPLAPIAWASAPDCQAKLSLLEQAARTGRLAAGERPPIVVVLPGSPDAADWLAPPSVAIAADLPLAVHERSDLAQLDVPCLLMIEPPRDLRVEHRPLGRDMVRSFYLSGTRNEHNPDYDLAQLRVRQAERAAKDDGPDILGVGDPMLDLVGTLIGSVVAGFSQGRGEHELDEAMLELTTTPRSRDQPIYRAYEFEQTTVLAGKEATIPIALLDRLSGRVWRAELHQRERRELAIIDGLDPRDRDYEAHSAASLTRFEFERWQRDPPRLELSAIAAALREADPAPPPSELVLAASADPPADAGWIEPQDLPQDLDAAVALPPSGSDPWQSAALAGAPAQVEGWQASPAATAPWAASRGDPRAASVVRLLAGQRSGSGVYVRYDLVLTTAVVVERASVVDVVTADGARLLGLVAHTDPVRSLALVQVARPGAPVALHDGPPPAAGRAIEAIVQSGAGGTTLAAGRYLGTGPATGLSLPAFADLAYIDAPALSDQPEATPWFLGDELIALGTGAAVERAGGPFGAIGADEIAAFLYGAGGALAALH